MPLDDDNVHADDRSAEARNLFVDQLEDRIAAIEESWSEYRRGGWSEERLDTLYSRVAETSETSSELRLLQLHEAAFSIEVYLSSFVDSGKHPSPHQTKEIDGLMRTLKSTADTLTSSMDAQVRTSGGSIFIFADVKSLAMHVEPALHDLEFRVEVFDDARALVSAMGDTLPKAILTDAALLPQLDPISAELVRLESQEQHKIPLIFVSDIGTLQARVEAMRAGADAYFVAPFEASSVAAQVARLSHPEIDDRHRVMIVEDDPTQADFAAGILHKAGMETRKVTEPLSVIDELSVFHPDLILMDLYMPDVNGMELTTIIRDYKEFAAIPIVFLSGERSAEKQMNALSVGGDDFITKPVSPKQLITVVEHRVRRSRAMARAYGGYRQHDRVTGLFSRQHFVDRLAHHLRRPPTDDRPIAVLHVRPDGLDALRDRLGIGGLDALLKKWAVVLTELLGEQDMGCRVDDHSIAICLRGRAPTRIRQFADQLCQRLQTLPGTTDTAAQFITASIGLVLAVPGDDETGVLARAERACTQAEVAGGNRCTEYEAPTTRVEVGPVDESIVAALRQGLAEDALTILYQPILDLRSRGSESYEIMLRVPLANGDLIDEQGYRAAAERADLLRDIDRSLLLHAMEILKERRESGRKTNIFVRQSKISAANPDYPEIVSHLLDEGGVAGTGLVLDFRLTDVSPNLKQAQVNFAALRELDVDTCISRFPEKPAAFKVLRFLGSRYLSVAPRLLKADRAIISAVTRMAHEADARVIVPNVDDARSIDLHWSAGADFLQGDFIQRPLENLDYDFSQVII